MKTTFESTRVIIEERLIAAAGGFSITTSEETVEIFRNGTSFKQPNDLSHVVMFIQDAGHSNTTFGERRGKSSGVLKFKIKVLEGRQNSTRKGRLIADVINQHIGSTIGSGSLDGTLFINEGSLHQISDNEEGYLVYDLDFMYDYYD